MVNSANQVDSNFPDSVKIININVHLLKLVKGP